MKDIIDMKSLHGITMRELIGNLEVRKNMNSGRRNVIEIREDCKKVKSFLKINEKVVQCLLQKISMNSRTRDIHPKKIAAGVHQNTFHQTLPELIHLRGLRRLPTMIGTEELITGTRST